MISALFTWTTLLSAVVLALPPGPARHHHRGVHGHRHLHDGQIDQFPEYDPPVEVSTPEASTILTATVVVGDSMVAEDSHVPPTNSPRMITLPIRSKMPAPTTPGDLAVDMPARNKREVHDDNMVQIHTASTCTITLIVGTAVPIPTSPVGVGVDSPAPREHVGVGVENAVQIPVGRTRAITPAAASIAQPSPPATSPAAPSEVFLDTKEMARDRPAAPVNPEANHHKTKSTLRRRAATAIGRRQAISDSTIWFFLASFGIFMTGVAWNVYVQVGMERERRMALELALSDQELGKVRVPGLAFRNGADVNLARVPPAVERVPGAFL